MEEKKRKFISEENYQKGKSVIKKVRTILFAIGAIMIIAGIVLVIIGATRKGVSMEDEGWFDSQKSKNGFIFGGVGLLCFGIVVLFWGMMTFIYSHNREMLSFGASAVMPVADEIADVGAPTIEKVGKAFGKGIGGVVGGIKEGWTGEGESNTVVCPECNTENSKKSKFCKNCGKSLSNKDVCPKCGKKMEADAKFCSNCGEKRAE